MKKANIIGAIIFVIMFLWFFISMLEIGFKSSSPNAQYSPLNIFTIVFPSSQPYASQEDGVIYSTTRVACGEVESINASANKVTFLLDDGSLFTAQVENAANFNPDGYYAIFFDTMGTQQIEDDEIVKTFVECW